MTAIDTILQPGEPIPDDVTEVSDADDDTWTVTDGRWTCEATLDSVLAPRFKGWSADQLVAKHGPLTVTAVREQPAEPEVDWDNLPCRERWPAAETGAYDPRCCRFPKSCSVEDEPIEQPASCPAHGKHPHNGPGVVQGGAVCLDCPTCRPPAEPEPQQADASPLLDLVRQHGDARVLALAAMHAEEPDVQRRHLAEAAATFARIAALVPQQPVQARTTFGDLIWQHIPCGWPAGWLPDATPDTGPDGDPIGCHEPGPWRPLLVAAPDGDSTPEPVDLGEALDDAVGDYEAARAKLLAVVGERDEARASAKRNRELLDGAAGLLGVPETGDLLAAVSSAVKACANLERQRDEARAKASRHLATIAASENACALEEARAELAEARAEVADLRTRVDHLRNWRSEHDKRERERDEARAAHARAQADAEHWREVAETQASLSQPDQLVLRLPEVPEGTVALTGIESGERRESPGLGPNGLPYWCGKDGLLRQLGAVLDMEPGGVRVELAPPSEPRTWPKLDELAEDIKTVRGTSGRTYHQSHFAQSIPVFCGHDADGRPVGPGIPFHALQTFDGPLTEVLDGEAGL